MILSHYALTLLSLTLTIAVSAQPVPGFLSVMRANAGKPLPHSDNGHLCGVEVQTPRVYVVNQDGRIAFDQVIQIEEAHQIVLYSCTVSTSGIVAVAGHARDSKGQMVGFIATIDSGGKIRKIQRSSEFAISRLHYDRKGNLWAVGAVPAPLRAEGNRDVLVRLLNADGAAVQSTVIPFSKDPRFTGHPGVTWFAAPSPEGLVILSHLWKKLIFVPYGNSAPRTLSYENPSNTDMVTGFAVTDQGEIYITTQGKANDIAVGERAHRAAHGSYRWTGSNWEPVNLASGYQALLGATGNNLLLYTNASVEWVHAPR